MPFSLQGLRNINLSFLLEKVLCIDCAFLNFDEPNNQNDCLLMYLFLRIDEFRFLNAKCMHYLEYMQSFCFRNITFRADTHYDCIFLHIFHKRMHCDCVSSCLLTADIKIYYISSGMTACFCLHAVILMCDFPLKIRFPGIGNCAILLLLLMRKIFEVHVR